MTDEWLKQYRLIEANDTPEGELRIWHSSGSNDVAWDEFLMKSHLGQFQQSSMWALVKEVEGWECLRVVATIDKCIAGGFQILWRRTRLGGMGYVSKGPVAVPETENIIERLVALMINQARKHKISALIVQPPDDSKVTSDILGRCRFMQSNPMGVIETTLVVDVGKGHDALDKGMNRNTRRRVRLAKQSGLVIREGTAGDIGAFFNLMSDTCKRQQTLPNPGSVEGLGQLWRTFSQRNLLRVFLAEYNNEVVAGLLGILFGNKVSLWKKGWNSKGNDCYPNDLLCYDALHWACSNNFANCDFIALDRTIADSLMQGRQLSETQQKTRDMFNLRFGGMPKYLPPARVWIDNPIVKFGYEKILIRLKLLSKLKKFMG